MLRAAMPKNVVEGTSTSRGGFNAGTHGGAAAQHGSDMLKDFRIGLYRRERRGADRMIETFSHAQSLGQLGGVVTG